MKRLAAIMFSGLLMAVASGTVHAAPEKYELDPEHTSIAFLADHIGYEKLIGMFLESEGSFTFVEEAMTVSDIRIVIQSESIFTNHEKRDGHLRSADFLNTREFPELVFVGTRAEQLSENKGRIYGEFTMLGQTHPMELDVTLNKIGPYPWGDNYVVGISARGSVQRSEWGMTYGVEDGLVGDQIDFMIEFEAIRQ